MKAVSWYLNIQIVITVIDDYYTNIYHSEMRHPTDMGTRASKPTVAVRHLTGYHPTCSEND